MRCDAMRCDWIYLLKFLQRESPKHVFGFEILKPSCIVKAYVAMRVVGKLFQISMYVFFDPTLEALSPAIGLLTLATK